MSTQPPANDPRNIWQSESQEKTKMSLNDFRQRLGKLQSRLRRKSITSVVIGVAIMGFFLLNLAQTEALLERFALALFALGTVAAVLPYAFSLWKGTQYRNPAPDMAMTTGIEFYRRLLQPQRSYEKGTAVCLLLIFFGLMLILLPGVAKQIENPSSPGSLRSFLPFMILLVGWGASFLVMHRRHQQWLRHELDQLSALEKEER